MMVVFRTCYLNATILVALIAAPFAAAAGQEDGSARPNIVLILTDDQRYDMLGCTGHAVARTPNIDRLAREGMLFRKFYVATPLCSPSRASILTGQYPHKHQVINNDKLGLDVISHTLMSFPRLLRRAGYETAFIGKWHMSNDDSRRPGFDRWFSFKGQGAYLDPVVDDDGRRRQLDGYMSDHLNRAAQEWLARPRSAPFCLIVAHKAVHAPYLPAPRHEKLYADYTFVPPPVAPGDRAGKPALNRKVPPVKAIDLEGVAPEPGEPRYGRGQDPASIVRDQLRCLAAVDDGVGQIIAALQASKQLDRTLVLYTSDNGYLMGEHGEMDNKRWPYDPSVRVPLLVRYPPLCRPGTVCDRLTVNVDLAPTILELAGVTSPVAIHGRSLVPLLRDPAAEWRNAVLTEHFLEKVAPRVPTWQAARTDRWFYVRYPEHADWDELYDLQADPHEDKNIATDSAAAPALTTMRQELQGLLKATR
jgi:arylsulfatase A-like enzyme